jgi:hypothetical protein
VLWGDDAEGSSYLSGTDVPGLINTTRNYVKNQCKCGLDGKPG